MKMQKPDEVLAKSQQCWLSLSAAAQTVTNISVQNRKHIP
jgi:hypothetical protein